MKDWKAHYQKYKDKQKEYAKARHANRYSANRIGKVQKSVSIEASVLKDALKLASLRALDKPGYNISKMIEALLITEIEVNRATLETLSSSLLNKLGGTNHE